MKPRLLTSLLAIFLLASCSASAHRTEPAPTPDTAAATTAQALATGNARFEAMVVGSATAIHLTAEAEAATATPAPTHPPEATTTATPALPAAALSDTPRPAERLSPTVTAPADTPAPLPTPAAPGWEGDPTALILRYWAPDAHPAAYAITNIIPPLQVWGDGHLIWLSGGTVDYQRQLMEGYLSPDQLSALLQRIVAAGFLGWKDSYVAAAPLPPHILAVKIAGQPARRVLVADYPPEGFEALVNYLLALPASAGQAKPYAPASAILRATQFPLGEPGPDIPAWPEKGYSLDSASAGAGLSIEGETLAFAWDLVNKYPAGPALVQSNGKSYYITLAVPGVSLCTGPRDSGIDALWSCP